MNAKNFVKKYVLLRSALELCEHICICISDTMFEKWRTDIIQTMHKEIKDCKFDPNLVEKLQKIGLNDFDLWSKSWKYSERVASTIAYIINTDIYNQIVLEDLINILVSIEETTNNLVDVISYDPEFMHSMEENIEYYWDIIWSLGLVLSLSKDSTIFE